MKLELINTPSEFLTPKEQVLFNRGIPKDKINHYLNLTDDDINPPEIFGEELLSKAADVFLSHLRNDSLIVVIVDCDCDGYTSSAILINYISDLKGKDWVEDHVHWYMHTGKQHGLQDCMDWINEINPQLVLIPDAGSNDYEQLKTLHEAGKDIIIMDHHEIEGEPYPECILINSQLPQYPNKFLSGAGVTWQFCKYIDKVTLNNFADWYLDLCATGLDGDMMSLTSPETRRLIFKGLEPDNIHNPFLHGMWQKNMFKLGENPTAWGFTFYVVPFVNAITRSGTQEEKELIFKSMLKFKANDLIPSTKRGCKGQTETVVEQAVRTCTNVKNRQGKAETVGMELVEHLIQDNNMLDHKVLLFLLEPGQIKSEIRGLVANKIMAKYQRPCCMLTKRVDETGRITYEGSARGCDKVGVTDFKGICAKTNAVDYTIGHPGAFGLGLTVHYPGEDEVDGEALTQFIDSTDEQLKDMSSEPIYQVDYIWDGRGDINPQDIIEIAELAPYWGKDCEESIIAIQGIEITKSDITIMASNTLKITLPNGINIIKFRYTDEEFNKLYYENSGFIKINAICTCNINNWNGRRYPQLLLQDFDIVNKCAYVF